ncbi:DUF1697 domain-containing protein [Dyadobacter sediminis]|uniref:DUF1697 domain-containing protein n=1 Tax=Dyadobacter sediminis TaxID=1493691 RepID=UPI00148715B9|nr:DUF1697 domain-containing protein [Dyadobacter sediminis]GGB82766.1 hypothetical protein GCM10011325_07900 [Dyadobacter sediminis]
MNKTTYIALLRGINVSGSNLIKMPVLQTLFEAAGCEAVKTYMQSGNVVFTHQTLTCQDLVGKIMNMIRNELEMNVPVLVMKRSELLEIRQNNPFLHGRNEEVSQLHVTFLSEKPDPEKWEKMDPGKYLPDELVLADQVIYLFCPSGYGKTKLHNNFFESKLKVTATTRNWKTILALADGFQD